MVKVKETNTNVFNKHLKTNQYYILMTEEQPSMYQNGKIYKIVDNGYNLCFYGSTVQPLSKMLSGHGREHTQYMGGNRSRPITV